MTYAISVKLNQLMRKQSTQGPLQSELKHGVYGQCERW